METVELGTFVRARAFGESKWTISVTSAWTKDGVYERTLGRCRAGTWGGGECALFEVELSNGTGTC